jgi:hypothetical protein
VFDYIEMFDNPTRKHARNGMLSPDALRHGEVPFKKAYLHMFVDRIDISRTGAKIRVRKGSIRRKIDHIGEDRRVPICMSEWRALRDSNPCIHRERVVS